MTCSVLHANLQFSAAAPKQRADLHLKGQAVILFKVNLMALLWKQDDLDLKALQLQRH